MLIAFMGGFASGWATHWLLTSANTNRPIYLSPRRIYEYIPPVAVTPMSHFVTWQTWSHRFITFAETLASEQGRPPHRLPSYAAMQTATSRTWRTFRPYISILAQSGLVEVRERGGIFWLTHKGERRAALASLPYPTDPRQRPPRFPWVTA